MLDQKRSSYILGVRFLDFERFVFIKSKKAGNKFIK